MYDVNTDIIYSIYNGTLYLMFLRKDMTYEQ